MIEQGYRVDYHTWQEHRLIGSTVSKNFAEEPHKPLGILRGNLTIEEAQTARRLATFSSAIGRYFYLDGFVAISLEQLNVDGNTVRDPQVLDDKLNPIATNYSDDFPARRK